MDAARVLVVDDDDLNRMLLAMSLSAEGYSVLEAADGQAALDCLNTEPVDLVITDIEMPVMNGYTLLAERRGSPSLVDIPFIVISSVDEMASIVRCIELGAEDYLPKPFDPVLLRARLSAGLDRKRRRDREVAYLHDVSRLAEAASALEARSFTAAALESVTARDDELGHLARVFVGMAREVQEREAQLRAQLRAQSYVFLSYARGDRARIESIVAELTEAGVRVWLDRHDIAGGASWASQIVQSIRGCAAMLVACSPAALDSRNVRQEIQLAWKHSRPYVPLILEPVEFPDEVAYHLEGWQWVDVLDEPVVAWLPALLLALERFDVLPQVPSTTE